MRPRRYGGRTHTSPSEDGSALWSRSPITDASLCVRQTGEVVQRHSRWERCPRRVGERAELPRRTVVLHWVPLRTRRVRPPPAREHSMPADRTNAG
jgi:hypothetical protein